MESRFCHLVMAIRSGTRLSVKIAPAWQIFIHRRYLKQLLFGIIALETRNDAAGDDVVLHGPDDDGVAAVISFLYIACVEILRICFGLVTMTLLCALIAIHWPIQAADWLLDKAKGVVSDLHVWLGE